jgi:hypothetical protein
LIGTVLLLLLRLRLRLLLLSLTCMSLLAAGCLRFNTGWFCAAAGTC